MPWTLRGHVVSDPPTQTEMQSLANKVDELLLALRLRCKNRAKAGSKE